MKKTVLLLILCLALGSCMRYHSPMVKSWTPKDHSKDGFKSPRKNQRR